MFEEKEIFIVNPSSGSGKVTVQGDASHDYDKGQQHVRDVGKNSSYPVILPGRPLHEKGNPGVQVEMADDNRQSDNRRS